MDYQMFPKQSNLTHEQLKKKKEEEGGGGKEITTEVE